MTITSDLIHDYNPNWVEQFDQLKETLEDGLSTIEMQIEHVGSTAVQGLAAKSIIDIDIIYFDHAVWPNILEGLQLLNYRHAGDQGIKGREVFKRNKTSQQHPILDQIKHHLYVCHSKNQELQRHLAFRDHLRANEKDRNMYADLKREIAAMAGEDRKIYAELKESMAKHFIESILVGTSNK